MSQMQRERKRAQNWEQTEIDIIFDLIVQHIDILENKKGDSTTNRKKVEAWKEVETCFQTSSACGSVRNLTSIKSLWKRLKIQAKAEVREYNIRRKKTGGGPAPVNPSLISLKIKELLPAEFEPSDNIYDDDNTSHSETFIRADDAVGLVPSTSSGLVPTTFRSSALVVEDNNQEDTDTANDSHMSET